MKPEKIRPVLAGLLTSILLSWGAVGCLRTGFGLTVSDPAQLWTVCILTAVLCNILFLWKWGQAAVLCILALWAGFLWHRGEAGQQILLLIKRISRVYDMAYDWGVLSLTQAVWNSGRADLPLQILGCGIGVLGSRCVVRGKRTWPAVLAAILPLALCLVVTDTVPEGKYLFLLLLGLVLLLLSASVRKLDGEQAGKLILLLLLPAALTLGLLFRAVPQDGYVNQSEEVREKILDWVESLPEKWEDSLRVVTESIQTGEAETVNLKTLGRQSSLSYPVMEVTSDRGGAVYLRGQDYDSYDGFGWTATPHRSEEFTFGGEAAGWVEIVTRSRGETQYVPYYPAQVQTLVGGNLDNPGKEKRYSLERRVLPRDWRELVAQRAQGAWESELVFATVLEASNQLDAARYLTLPTETRLAAEKILNTLLADEISATEKADAIAAFVRRTAPYDRDTARMPEDARDFALWFLEEAETGYCVHFATSAVVLLRAARIPARYVTGYLAHCRPGETVTVTADTAHAWAEYYEPQLACWIPLEATPAEGVPQDTHAEERESSEAMEESEQEEPSVPTRPQQTRPTETEPLGTVMIPGSTPQKRTLSVTWLWPFVLLGAAVLQWRIRVNLRRRKQQTEPNSRALACWQEIVLLAKLQKKQPPRELRDLAQKAKFSQHTLTEEELARMEDYMEYSIDNLKQQPWYMQLLNRIVFAAY